MATQTLLTAEEFDRLPVEAGQRLELLEGEIVEMASAGALHQGIVLNMGASFRSHLLVSRSGFPLPDVEFAFGPQTRLRPDLAIVSAADWASLDKSKSPLAVVPVIVVEVVSPSESAYQLNRKVRIYLFAGVDEVWLVYPDVREAQVHSRPGSTRYNQEATLTSPLLPGWQLGVNDLFLGL